MRAQTVSHILGGVQAYTATSREPIRNRRVPVRASRLVNLYAVYQMAAQLSCDSHVDDFFVVVECVEGVRAAHGYPFSFCTNLVQCWKISSNKI